MTHNVKNKADKTTSVVSAIPASNSDKKSVSSTEQLLLTLMEEIKGIKSQINSPNNSNASSTSQSKTNQNKVKNSSRPRSISPVQYDSDQKDHSAAHNTVNRGQMPKRSALKPTMRYPQSPQRHTSSQRYAHSPQRYAESSQRFTSPSRQSGHSPQRYGQSYRGNSPQRPRSQTPQRYGTSRPFPICKFCGSDRHHMESCQYYEECELCESTDHVTSDCHRNTRVNRHQGGGYRQTPEPTVKWVLKRN
jgi:hypothetical protein